MALKLDVSKAYDKVEWSFLEQVLVKLGFPPPFIRLVMLCVSSVSYSFLLGGKQFGALIPERGLRQGDPLSPYLFLLCTESFSSLLVQAERVGRIQGVAVCWGAPAISHLLFADDTLIFCRASLECTQSIQDILEVYRLASGQEINFSKSSVAFSRNTVVDMCAAIVRDLTIRRENKMELYLGLPSRVVRSKRELFATIRDRVWTKIKGWNEKFLSQAGKKILIKAVIQAIPTYAMGCFRLPISLLKEIQSMVADFWWSNQGHNKIHWVSWQRLCDSKLLGGLGFRRLHLFNLAMLAKQLWRIWLHPERLLSRVLKARYFPWGDIFSASLGSRPSYTWRSVMAAHDLFIAGCRWRIGSRLQVRVWTDPWLPRLRSFKPITPVSASLPNLLVSDLIEPISVDWDVAKVQELFWPIDSEIILGIPLSRTGAQDLLTWHYSNNGRFSVRSTYHLACALEERPGCSSLGLTDSLWWRKAGCPLCGDEQEDTLHALTLCPFARLGLSLCSSFICVASSGVSGAATPSVPQVPSSWQPPPPDVIKVNFDGATFDQGKEMSVGVVARSANGHCVAWLSQRVAKPGVGNGGGMGHERGYLFGSTEGMEVVKHSANAVAHFFARSALHDAEGDHVMPAEALSLVSLDSLVI
ncbi:UNVERIFIED_CONTAM: putative mitochondrial protein [Sesamum latifolium]|uniref:Mitochondrial protein n=1 Tax=Sesamum latifolium TaxID=2727402 RepID=A0AAW2XT15_9LAMI